MIVLIVSIDSRVNLDGVVWCILGTIIKKFSWVTLNLNFEYFYYIVVFDWKLLMYPKNLMVKIRVHNENMVALIIYKIKLCSLSLKSFMTKYLIWFFPYGMTLLSRKKMA